MPELDSHLRSILPVGQYSLTGPVAKAADGNLPLRGDLAHIKLAGRYFVPHYAVPMPHRAGPEGAAVRKIAKGDAEVLVSLEAGDVFDVLDVSGGWAWGQVPDDGPVGYIELGALSVVVP